MRKQERIKDKRIPLYIGKIKELYHQGEEQREEFVAKMKELREIFIEHEQPTIVKSLRLCYEHIEKHGEYQIAYWGNDESLLEEGEAIEQPASALPAFDYFTGLISNPSNKYNRDEIKEVNLLLKASLSDD